MSIAGIRSNRGDGYQTLLALEWALTILSDPDFQWIEVDSVTYSVDDVVIGKSDGTQICCQCKKNHPHFKAWTIADLADELDKASSLLSSNKNAEVRFYSRTPFGAIAKLHEHSITHANEASYHSSLGKGHQQIDADLAKQLAIQAPNLSTYEFLLRTTFETSYELDRMEALLHERLRYISCNPKVAYDALWRRIDQLGARMDGSSISASAQHRLTKDDLKGILHQAGAMLVPIMNLAEVRASFASTSAIGRAWQREIAGQRISSSIVNEMLAAIDAKKRAILLTGLPGSGKTCVMLAVQEVLEQRAQTRTDMVSLFIQSREFADLATAQDRQAQGLPEQWVEKVARMAEDSTVVVVIDSLDVLSIAREHSVLTYFLAQIDRLLLIPNIIVVTACRDFDRHYDRRLAGRQWDYELKCQPLNWDTEIAPLFNKLGIHTKIIDAVTRELIRNPRELALFVELAQREGSFNIVTSQALAQRYLDTIVRGNSALQSAEPCLYYAYHNHFEKISPLLVRIRREGSGKDLETWGRISALAALTSHIDFANLLEDLKALDATEAWRGAASVWTHSENIKQHRDQCLSGIEAGLNASNPHAAAIAQQIDQVFRNITPVISIPIELIRLCFAVFESDSENKHHRLFGFGEWLNAISYRDPEQALTATEIYLIYVSHTKPYLYDHENNLTQLMTRLFAEAEEREESDHGAMLQRVVLVQDTLLSLGVDGINDWLKAAERP